MSTRHIQVALVAVVVLALGVYFAGGWSSAPSTNPEAGVTESTGTQTSSGEQGTNMGSSASVSQPSGAPPTSATPKSILGTQWTWQRSEFPDGTKTIPQDSAKFVITFGNDKQMSGMTDCNNLSAPFVVNGAALNFGNIAATSMACPSSLERTYTEQLAHTASYAIAGDELRLTLMNGPGTMVFKRHIAISLEGTTFRLVSFSGNAVSGNYTLTFNNDLVSAKFCNTMSGSYTLAAGRVTANITGSKMYCASPSRLMEIENAFLPALQNGMQLSLKGSTLTLTGSKGEQFVFTAGN